MLINISSMDAEELRRTFLPATAIAEQILKAFQNNLPYSLVRIGDGENVVLSQLLEEGPPELEWVKQGDHHYCGIVIPNLQAASEMTDAIRNADVVGVLYQDECVVWRPITQRVFKEVQLQPKQIMYAFGNHALAETPAFHKLLTQAKVFLLGRKAEPLAKLLQAGGVYIAGTALVDSYDDLPHIFSLFSTSDFDVCLASCGVNAVIISDKVKRLHGKIGIDFGSAADKLLDGSLRLYDSGCAVEVRASE
ncbi:MAG: hypothetical protein KGZ63_01385 [Clostridiales bacterium]|nr:hypothetical protein [Clostridiales bacterium]